LGKDGRVDLVEVEKLALKHQPKLMWVGTTAYPFKLEFEEFSKIAEKAGAYLVADLSHVAGLVIGGAHPDPEPFVDVITTTTHKTLRGPRGAMILVTKKGLEKDPELSSKIDKAVFPGLQGGPHENQIGALAIALEEASKPEFKKYAKQVVKNAQVLAKELGCQTENHLILWDLSEFGFGLGYQMHLALEEVGIYANKNAVPGEKASAFYPSGIRLGTPALTSRGIKEKEMVKIASWILEVLEVVKGHDLPQKQEERRDFIKNYKLQMTNDKKLQKIKKEVINFATKYPVPGI
jgi:glycine hydroxymethyltransferase